MVGIVIIVGRQPDLFQVVCAAHAIGSLADFLDRGQQEADQNADDGDDNKQFDQGKGSARGWSSHGACLSQR